MCGTEFMPKEFTGLCTVTEILSYSCLDELGNGLLKAQLRHPQQASTLQA